MDLALPKKWFKSIKNPFLNSNTFFIWEPCTHSHAEVVPGYARYLIDLGFDVSIFVSPKRYKEGLFSRFNHERIHFNYMCRKETYYYFKENGLGEAKGIILTSSGKIGTFEQERLLFNKKPDQKVLLVEHDVKAPTENNTLSSDIITLRKPYYKNAKTTAINPHYFGDIRITGKNSDITNFITVGAVRHKKKNSSLIINTVNDLHNHGVSDFKVTVVGNSNVFTILKIPRHLRKYFDFKGRLNFSDMYNEIEKADFFLPLLDPENSLHERYITTGSSGAFQLIYGFRKPCLIEKKFAEVNCFSSDNSIIYNSNSGLLNAICMAINMSQENYNLMQNNLSDTADSIYKISLENIKGLAI